MYTSHVHIVFWHKLSIHYFVLSSLVLGDHFCISQLSLISTNKSNQSPSVSVMSPSNSYIWTFYWCYIIWWRTISVWMHHPESHDGKLISILGYSISNFNGYNWITAWYHIPLKIRHLPYMEIIVWFCSWFFKY